MERLSDIYVKWNSKDGHGDKGTAHSYLEVYEKILENYRNKSVNLLEIGLAYGESLELWYGYLGKRARIYGIDIHDKEIKPYMEDDRFKITIGDATQPNILDKFKRNKFDIIIDDASHRLQDQIDTFNIFKPKMKKGGYYIIEDVNNIDDIKDKFLKLHSMCSIVDNRHVKGRYDDVLIIYKF